MIPQTPVPRDFAESIGYFVVWFAQAEVSLNVLLGMLLHLKNEEQHFLQGEIQNIAVRLSMFKSLIATRAPEESKPDLLKWHSDLKDLSTIRNQLLHNQWQQWSSETGACLKLNFPQFGNKTTPILDDFTIPSIWQYGWELHDLVLRRVALVGKYKLDSLAAQPP